MVEYRFINWKDIKIRQEELKTVESILQKQGWTAFPTGASDDLTTIASRTDPYEHFTDYEPVKKMLAELAMYVQTPGSLILEKKESEYEWIHIHFDQGKVSENLTPQGQWKIHE